MHVHVHVLELNGKCELLTEQENNVSTQPLPHHSPAPAQPSAPQGKAADRPHTKKEDRTHHQYRSHGDVEARHNTVCQRQEVRLWGGC